MPTSQIDGYLARHSIRVEREGPRQYVVTLPGDKRMRFIGFRARTHAYTYAVRQARALAPAGR